MREQINCLERPDTIPMTDEKDVELQRLAERRAYRLTLTDDAKRLMDTLKRQSPEAWQSYWKTVDQEAKIEDQTYNTILQTAFALFPGRETREVADLLRRMLDIVIEEIAKNPHTRTRL